MRNIILETGGCQETTALVIKSGSNLRNLN